MNARRIAQLLAASAITALAPTVLAQSTFTYQGRLDRNGSPYTGSANILFRFYDAPAGGSQVGTQQTRVITVEDGLFTTDYDPGLTPFQNNTDVWLEVQVIVLGDPGWTLLTPRQKVTPAPFSLATRGLFVTGSGPAAKAGVGSASTAKFTVDETTNAPCTLAIDSGLNSAQVSEIDLRGLGSSIWRIGKTTGNELFIDRTNVSRMFTFDSTGHSAFGFQAPLNPGAFSRTITLHGNNTVGTPNIGSAAITFSNPALAQQWQAGIAVNGPFRFEKFGGGSQVVSVPILEVRGGSDIAEPYDVAPAGDLAPAPGMVVVIDAAQTGALRIADKAYDHAVAGIISGANGVNSGLTLTQEGSVADGKLPVANVGRVWCYVDADANGAVRPGDLLTTSATPGHAMRADPADANGAVLGKAMSSLESGRGMVLVLVGLQ